MDVVKLLDMDQKQLIVQLEKASVTLTKLKNTNAALRKRIRELELARAETNLNNAVTNKPPPTNEVAELKTLLEVAQKAAIANLSYAQEIKTLNDELLEAQGKPLIQKAECAPSSSLMMTRKESNTSGEPS
jgi:hypothetical protein